MRLGFISIFALFVGASLSAQDDSVDTAREGAALAVLNNDEVNYCEDNDDIKIEEAEDSEASEEKDCVIDTRTEEEKAAEIKRKNTIKALKKLASKYEEEEEFGKQFLVYNRWATLIDGEGFFKLADAYQKGIGTKEDKALAFQNYKKAADLKYTKAYLILGKA